MTDWREQVGITKGLEVTVDKHDIVVEARRPNGAPEREWRFTRVKRRLAGRSLPVEREQAILADYVDHPEMKVEDIAKAHHVSNGAIRRTVDAYNVPARRPRRNATQAVVLRKIDPAELDDPEPTDPRPVCRVTLVREFVEEIRAADLLEVAAYYDGQPVKIRKLEWIE
jgi:hypothetical protein